MSNRRLYRYAVDLFIELLRQVQGKRMKPYRCNDNDTSSWITFCDYCKENKILVTEEFIRKFIEYGLQSWFNVDTSYTQKQNVRFSWILTQLKKDYKVQRKKGGSQRLSSLLTKVRPIEEKFKSEYLNSPRGLLWCKANTTLFLHKSPSCAICDFKDECKEILRVNMPNVYKLRGYK